MDIRQTTQSSTLASNSKHIIKYMAMSSKVLSKTLNEAMVQNKIIAKPTSAKEVTKQSKILTRTNLEDLDKGRNQIQLRKSRSVSDCTHRSYRRSPETTHRLIHLYEFRQGQKEDTLTGRSGVLANELTGAYVVTRVRAVVKQHSPVDPPTQRRSISTTLVNFNMDPVLSGSFCVNKNTRTG